MDTRKRNMLFAILATTGLAAAAAATIPTSFAQSDTVRPEASPTTRGEWLPVPRVVERLEAEGYSAIEEIERDDGYYEVKATDRDGRRVELKLDPGSGEVLKREVKRDERRDDGTPRTQAPSRPLSSLS